MNVTPNFYERLYNIYIKGTGSSVTGNWSQPVKQRKFQTEWVKQFPWVIYHPTDNIMHCKTCLNFPRLADPENNSFYKGSQLFHLNGLKVKQYKSCKIIKSLSTFD